MLTTGNHDRRKQFGWSHRPGSSMPVPGEYMSLTASSTGVTVQFGEVNKFHLPRLVEDITNWIFWSPTLWGDNVYPHGKNIPHTDTMGSLPQPMFRKVSRKIPHPSKITLSDEGPLPEVKYVTGYVPVVDNELLICHPGREKVLTLVLGCPW